MPPATSSARREWTSRLGLLAIGLVAGLVLLEMVLQAAAVVVRLSGAEPVAHAVGDRARVVCVGDSNTYGLWVEREEAWPQVLEQRWNAAPDANPIEVMNLGVPATNSSALRATLPKLLGAVRPQVVLVMVGANDFWTEPVPPPALDLGTGTLDAVRTHSRVWRLFRMLYRSTLGFEEGVTVVEGREDQSGTAVTRVGDVEIETRWKKRPAGLRRWTKELKPNLIAIVGQIQAAGAHPVLLTYAADDVAYARANETIRDVARMLHVPLIDPTPTFAARCPTRPCPLLLPDGHPTAEGYALLAEVVQPALTAAWPAAPPRSDP